MPKRKTSATPPIETMVTDSRIHESRRLKIEQEEEELRKLEELALEGKPVPDPVEPAGRDDDDTDDDGGSASPPAPKETDGEQENLTKEEETYKKRYGDLRRHMQKKEEEWKAKLEAAEKGTGRIRPPKSDEDIEAWAKQYPDLAGIVEAVASKKAHELFASAEAQLQAFEADKDEAARLHAKNIIMKSHPDFEDISNDDKFHDWAEKQPKWVQDAIYEQPIDPAGISRAIDLYKVDTGKTTQARKTAEKAAASSTRKGAGTTPTTDTGRKIWKESDIEKMTQEEFAKVEHEIDLAMNRGDFEYDISQPNYKRA